MDRINHPTPPDGPGPYRRNAEVLLVIVAFMGCSALTLVALTRLYYHQVEPGDLKTVLEIAYLGISVAAGRQGAKLFRSLVLGNMPGRHGPDSD